MTADETPRTALTEAAEGDPAAFARLISTYHDEMARVAFVVSGDVASAQEAVQSAWAKARQGLETMGNADRLPAWLMGLAAKQAQQGTQGKDKRREEAAAGESGAPVVRAAAAPAYRTEQREVANALAPLDAHDRMIVALRYIAAMNADEIGVELGMPGTAVQARIARVLSRLLKDLKGEPTETIEHYEHGLAQLVRSYGDLAVLPIDPDELAKVAIEQATIEATPAPTLAEQLAAVWERLAPVRARARKLNPIDWLLVGGIAVIVAAILLRGGASGPGAGPGAPDATRECESAELETRVVKWEGAGADAYRIATVEMRNVGKEPCLVEALPEPWLTAFPRDAILIGLDRGGGLLRIGPGEVMHTVVRARNFCGAPPRPPVSVAFRQGSTVIAAAPVSADDVSGVPPCGNYTGSKDDVQMDPWALGPAPA